MKNSVISSYNTLLRNIQILNLCAQRGLGKFTKTDFEFDENEDSESSLYDQEDTTDFSINEVEISGDDTSIFVKISKFVDWDVYHYWTFQISVSDFESVENIYDEYVIEQNLLIEQQEIADKLKREIAEKEAEEKRKFKALSDFKKAELFSASYNSENPDYANLEKIRNSKEFYITEDFVRVNNQNLLIGFEIRSRIRGYKGMKVAYYDTKISFVKDNDNTTIGIHDKLTNVLKNS